jgi:hypothetical protein
VELRSPLSFRRQGAIAFPFVHPESSSFSAFSQLFQINNLPQRLNEEKLRLQNANISLQYHGQQLSVSSDPLEIGSCNGRA